MGKSCGAMTNVARLGGGIAWTLALCACGQRPARVPSGTDRQVTHIPAPPERSVAPSHMAADAGETSFTTQCRDYPGTIGLSRNFQVKLSGNDRVDVQPWLDKNRPPPAKVDDLDAWGAEASDKDPARPEDAYTLVLAGDVTLREFSAVMAAFAWRGFVRPVVSVDGVDIDFYSGYVPAEAIRPVGTSLSTLNIVIEGETLYLTSVMMLDQWNDEVIVDHRFDVAALDDGCTGALALQLSRVCSHPRRPCDRVLFSGLRTAGVGPFLKTLALLRRILPERTPGVTYGPTVKPGVAARYRDGGSAQFLEMEGLIEPIADSMHP